MERAIKEVLRVRLGLPKTGRIATTTTTGSTKGIGLLISMVIITWGFWLDRGICIERVFGGGGIGWRDWLEKVSCGKFKSKMGL